MLDDNPNQSNDETNDSEFSIYDIIEETNARRAAEQPEATASPQPDVSNALDESENSDEFVLADTIDTTEVVETATIVDTHDTSTEVMPVLPEIRPDDDQASSKIFEGLDDAQPERAQERDAMIVQEVESVPAEQHDDMTEEAPQAHDLEAFMEDDPASDIVAAINARVQAVEDDIAAMQAVKSLELPEEDEGVSIEFDQPESSDEPEKADDAPPQPEPEQSAATSSSPPEPEWKVMARKIYEEREAKRKALIESRKTYEKNWMQARQQERQQLEQKRAAMEEQIKERLDREKQEKAARLDAMMEEIRAEKERKQREREAMDRKLRAEREERSYLNHEDAVDATPQTQDNPVTEAPAKPSSPPPTPKNSDLESRVSRLAKPEDD